MYMCTHIYVSINAHIYVYMAKPVKAEWANVMMKCWASN